MIRAQYVEPTFLRERDGLYEEAQVDQPDRMPENLRHVDLRLTEKGLRETEVWPPEQGIDALLRVLDEQMAEASPAEQTALEKVRDGVTSLGTGTATAVIRAWATHMAGPGSPFFG